MNSEFILLRQRDAAGVTAEPCGSDEPVPRHDTMDFAARLQQMALRNLDAIAADLDDQSSDPVAFEKRARALATVMIALDDIKRAQSVREIDMSIVDADDPRACPRDPAILRSTLADALDRINEKKNISTL